MASDRELKLRINSVNGIGQLTKAMKMVASAQLRKVESRSRATKPYTQKLKAVVGELSAKAGVQGEFSAFMRPHKKSSDSSSIRVGLIIISSDNGLCGAYNSNNFKFIEKTLQGSRYDIVKTVILGKKAMRYFSKRGFNTDYVVTEWHPDYKLAKELCERSCQWYLDGEVDEVHVFYTESLSLVKCEPRRLRFLPLATESIKDAESSVDTNTSSSATDYIFEPSVAAALEAIIPNYMRIIMQQVLLESKTSELGSRLTAMSNATENADELAQKLTLEYYRIRQNNITTEIIEISSGAEALA